MSKQNNNTNSSKSNRTQEVKEQTGRKPGGSKKRNPYRGKQGRKDSKDPRVNADNEREAKFIKQYEKDGMRPKVSDKPNDISWYSRNPELLKAAASLPFNSVLGQTIMPNGTQYIPGVMRLNFSFAYGGFDSSIYPAGIDLTKDIYPAAINQAGKSVYSFLVHANSRNYNYEYQDLQMVICAGIQVFCALATVIRAYGVAKTYPEKSIYAPDALLRGMGFDPDEFRYNLGQIWFDINNLITQTQQIWIPKELPLLKRWIWMCSNVFTDSQSALGQRYIFVPQNFHMYNETADTTGGSLEPATFTEDGTNYETLVTSNANNWNNWKSTIQHMIDRLVNSEDRGIMFGDILNAYGASNIFALPPVDVQTTILPVFNAEVLTQIENFTPTQGYCYGLGQTPLGLYPKMGGTAFNSKKSNAGQAPNTPVLNFHQPGQPTPEQIVVATRMMACGTVSTDHHYVNTFGSKAENVKRLELGSGTVMMPVTFGSEVPGTIYFVVKGSSSTWDLKDFFNIWPSSGNFTAWSMFSTNHMIPGDYLSFDWAPFLYKLGSASNTGAVGEDLGKVIAAYGDYDNYTILNLIEVGKLHQMAMYSEFGLPINL